MENKLKQIVIQKDKNGVDRVLVQYGQGFLAQEQNIANYSDLNDEEKMVWDSFVNMIIDSASRLNLLSGKK
tara:strand:- start:520 stop:732 length:213 start_codon:yes stop_codon:yes gene_type:complete